MADSHFKQIKVNRLRSFISRSLLMIGLALIIYVYYLTFHTPFWDLDLLLGMFIVGCILVFMAFSGKMWRLGTARSKKNFTRQGNCVNCGACCRLPVRCVFLFRDRCIIYRKRPKQCRAFPSRPGQIVSYDCGYSFLGE